MVHMCGVLTDMYTYNFIPRPTQYAASKKLECERACVHAVFFLCRKAIPTGMISGAMGQFLASPTDLVKTRLQMEGRRLLDGHKPRFGWHSVHTYHFATIPTLIL